MSQKSKSHQVDSTEQSQWTKQQFKSLGAGFVVILFLLASILIFYSYKVFPEKKILETPFFTLESNYFEDIQVLIWTLITKVVTVYLLAIWFATCKHWWYHAILIPMAMFIYQIASIIIFDISKYQDEISFYYTLPITLIIIVFLYGMRKLIAQNVTVINLQGDVDEELKKFERLDELKRLEKEKRKRMGSRDINDLL